MPNILGYDLVNEEKYFRAINGVVLREGKQLNKKQGGTCGVGEDATDEEKIAEYDRLGGLILKNGNKVKLGAFYDFEHKTIRPEPDIKFIESIEDTLVEVTEEEANAIKVAKEKTKTLKEKVKKAKKK